MFSLLILATVLLLVWLWATWKRESTAQFMAEWSYVLIVTSLMCFVMAIALKLR